MKSRQHDKFIDRRSLVGMAGAGVAGVLALPATLSAHEEDAAHLTITELRVTPIALPDPPLLSAGGCHGPYFLRNIVEVVTDAGIVGIGETHGGESNTAALNTCREVVIGRSPFAYRAMASHIEALGNPVYAGIELACLDAIGKAVGKRLCDLLGGPVRERVDFASYLFFRYAADHPAVLNDHRLVDHHGRDRSRQDPWGEIRTPDAMASLARQFQQRFGFRVHKLKAGVLAPDVEIAALEAIHERLGDGHLLRIDPNCRWTMKTALRVAKSLQSLPLEYYEDPVRGQVAMAEVRRRTELPMSTNSCVTQFEHIPEAVKTEPIDVVLGDHHGWGGVTAFPALGRIANVLGWQVSQHSNNHAGITMAAMIHVGAVTPELDCASDTHYVWLSDEADIIEGNKLPIRNGAMEIPAGVGVGVAINHDRLARAHETYQKCGMRRRDDVSTMRRFEPGWQRTLL